MSYAERLQTVAVLGAAGKMGSGITLLLAQEMADLSLIQGGPASDRVLLAIDVSDKALAGLMDYLRAQFLKTAEKRAVDLRKVYSRREDLVENADIVRPTTLVEAAGKAGLVFEAVNENPDLKVSLLSKIKALGSPEAWFLSNTSSIPISELNDRVKLEGRILGFHFYNPPAVQKLVELIRADATRPELAEFAAELAKKLRKVVVPARDVAGFIGNGHFMRDALYGLSEVERLAREHGFMDAVYMINRVSQDFLIRPMGIFQLVDYVGLDVCQSILGVMNARLPGGGLNSPLIDRMIAAGVRGGQFPDGSQKDGFLKYDKGRPAGVYDPDRNAYIGWAEVAARGDATLGPLPASAKPWKSVVQDPGKEEFLKGYFRELAAMKTPGAELAVRYGRKSKEAGLGLVSDRVALSEEDVNTVLLTGFYHAYGPINSYFD
jgi:3-hydroxyacyl-CoA dehydrogenase